jgi:sterol desaturase/sphingolipid hydroxylase (fatty acid hydroxylase superfamily)
MIDALSSSFASAQLWVFESVVQPLLVALGLHGLVEFAYEGSAWLLIGAFQIVFIALVLGALERWKPVEPVTDRATIRTDIGYTLIHRLGIFRLALFFSLDPLIDDAFGWLRTQGLPTWHLDQLWPGVTDLALVSLVVYLIVFDALEYAIHRAQHQWNWWWQLHSLHHAQRQMTRWSDNRNHLLDDLIKDLVVASVALLIGVAPGQFVAIVAIMQLSESLQHSNARLSFGALGERLWVSPRFHRLHHAIGWGHESIRAGRTVLGGVNFAVLLPVWDIMFRTANFEDRYEPTGVRDQVTEDRDYGRGFWAQQWLGLRRLLVD